MNAHNGITFEERVAEYVDSSQFAARIQGVTQDPKNTPLRFSSRRQELTLSQPFLQSLMRPTIESTIQHVEGVLRDPAARDVEYIFFVGGFAQCPLLFDMAKARLERAAPPPPSASTAPAAAASAIPLPARKVIRPAHADLSVLKGAVLYGLSPHVLQRISAWTWGVQCNDIWLDTKYSMSLHADRRITSDKGVVRCKNVLSTFVREGDLIDLGVPKEHSFVPVDRGRTMEVKIFRSPLKECRFTDEPHCMYVGSLSIQLPRPNADNSNDRGVKVRMFFGADRLRVELEVNTLSDEDRAAGIPKVKQLAIRWKGDKTPTVVVEGGGAAAAASGASGAQQSSPSSSSSTVLRSSPPGNNPAAGSGLPRS
jgi:hypothetical protein